MPPQAQTTTDEHNDAGSARPVQKASRKMDVEEGPFVLTDITDYPDDRGKRKLVDLTSTFMKKQKLILAGLAQDQ